MRDQIEHRLSNLKGEYDQGQKILAELSEKRERTVHSMLRISGAIQVLEELLAEEDKANAEDIPADIIEADDIQAEVTEQIPQ